MWEDHIYTDEPLFITDDQKQNLTPIEYSQMRKLDFSSPSTFRMDSRVFYLQAKFMEHFQDNYNESIDDFQCYYPTYRSMTTEQLRGYFSWRTQFRLMDGIYITNISYVYMYLYELLHCIGFDTPLDALKQLRFMYEEYGEFEPSLRKYLKNWIIDFVIYHQLDPKEIANYIPLSFDQAIDVLFHVDAHDDDELFQSLLEVSKYNLEKTQSFKKYPDYTKQLTCQIYRALDAQSQADNKIPYLKKYYKYESQFKYTLFQSAIFYNYLNITNMEFQLTPMQTYHCINKQWYVRKPYLKQEKEDHVTGLLHYIDRMIRKKYGLKTIKPHRFEKMFETLVIKQMRQPLQHAKQEIQFDLSILDQIRQTSEETSQKIMTEEEMMHEETEIALVTETDENHLGLDENQFFVLSSLLSGKEIQTYIQQKHLMLSVIVDAINEVLFDTFNDTVIEFDGINATIIEDYIDELKGMICNENT